MILIIIIIFKVKYESMNQWTNELEFKWNSNERWSIDKWDIVNFELSQQKHEMNIYQ